MAALARARTHTLTECTLCCKQTRRHSSPRYYIPKINAVERAGETQCVPQERSPSQSCGDDGKGGSDSERSINKGANVSEPSICALPSSKDNTSILQWAPAPTVQSASIPQWAPAPTVQSGAAQPTAERTRPYVLPTPPPPTFAPAASQQDPHPPAPCASSPALPPLAQEGGEYLRCVI